MPITTHINKLKNLTTYAVIGELTFDEVLSALEEFHADEPTKHVLWDLQDSKNIQLSSNRIKGVANVRPRFKGTIKSGKTAIVAREKFHYGLPWILQVESYIVDAPYNLMVFNNTDDAYQWFMNPN